MASPVAAYDDCCQEGRLEDPRPVHPITAPKWANNWIRSPVSRDDLERLVELGWLPKKSSMPWLTPVPGERVLRPLIALEPGGP